MPDWIRDVLRVVLLFAFPITALIAAGWTYLICAFGEFPSQSAMAFVYGLWALAGAFLVGIWILRPRRRSPDHGVRKLKLMADYECWPLWEASPGVVGNVDPDALPISQTLKDRLFRWAADFDATLNRDDPRRSGFPAAQDEAEFLERGAALGAALQAELGPAFKVTVKGG